MPIEMLVSFSALVHWCVTEGKAYTQKFVSVLSFPTLEYACAVVFVCCLIGQFESLAIVWNSQIGFKEHTNIQAMLDHYFIDDGIFMKESFFCLLWFAGSFSSVYFWNGFSCFLWFLFYKFYSCKLVYALADHNAAKPAI